MARKLTSVHQMADYASRTQSKVFRVQIWSARGKPTRAHITSIVSALMRDKFSLSLRGDEYEIGFFDKLDFARLKECPSFENKAEGGIVSLQDLEELVDQKKRQAQRRIFG